MKTKIAFSLMALGLALPVANLQAQEDARPPRGPRGDRPAPPFITALDTNKDGVLDKTEISASSEALKKLDTDKDGKVSMPELRGAPGRPGPGGEGRAEQPRRPRAEGEERAGERPQRERADERPQRERDGDRPMAGPPLIAALDANKNGTLETEELTAAPAALLKLDKNSDGKLTMDELQMGRGPGGARGERGGRPDGERPNRQARDAAKDGEKEKN